MGRGVTPRVYAGVGCQPWVEQSVVPLIALYAYLVPSWCHEIEVRYATGIGTGVDEVDEELGAYTLRVEPSPRYRRATFFVGGGWFEQEEPWKRRCIVHEIGHLYVAGLASLNVHLIEQLTEEDDVLRHTLGWQNDEAEEGCVEDFADLVCFLTGLA